MAGKRKRPMSPFMQSVLTEHECESLFELANHSGLPYQTLVGLAEPDYQNHTLSALVRVADALGIPLETFIRGLLNQDATATGTDYRESA